MYQLKYQLTITDTRDLQQILLRIQHEQIKMTNFIHQIIQVNVKLWLIKMETQSTGYRNCSCKINYVVCVLLSKF